MYEMLGTNRLEVVTMLSYSVVWFLLEVDNFLPNPGYDRSLLVIYRNVTMPNPGEVGCMLGLKITMPECVTQLVSVEFRSLLVVGTLTPHPGEVSYMRMRKIIRL